MKSRTLSGPKISLAVTYINVTLRETLMLLVLRLPSPILVLNDTTDRPRRWKYLDYIDGVVLVAVMGKK